MAGVSRKPFVFEKMRTPPALRSAGSSGGVVSYVGVAKPTPPLPRPAGPRPPPGPAGPPASGACAGPPGLTGEAWLVAGPFGTGACSWPYNTTVLAIKSAAVAKQLILSSLTEIYPRLANIENDSHPMLLGTRVPTLSNSPSHRVIQELDHEGLLIHFSTMAQRRK